MKLNKKHKVKKKRILIFITGSPIQPLVFHTSNSGSSITVLAIKELSWMELRTADLELGFPQQGRYSKSQNTQLASQRGNIFLLKMQHFELCCTPGKKHTNSTEITTAAQRTGAREALRPYGSELLQQMPKCKV